MDHRQLEQSLVEALPWIKGDGGGSSYYANEYLEKICQDIHYLPIPSQEEKADYFKALFTTINSGAEELAEGHAQSLDTILRQFDCLPANPRKIKMLVNRVALTLRAVWPEEGKEVTVDDFLRQYTVMLATAIIYTFHKSIHEQIESNPAYINEVMNYSKSDLEQMKDDLYLPMRNVHPAMDKEKRLPVNPSDSNVFRLHKMLQQLESITEAEITPYLRLKR